MTEVWYRFADRQVSLGVDPWTERSYGSRTEVVVHEYPVESRTPKGVWLSLHAGQRRFVRRDATKRWACPTKAEARASFLARKRRQLRILAAQARAAEEAIRLADDAVSNVFRSINL